MVFEMEYQDICGIYDIRFLVKRGIIITPPTLKTLDAVITLKRATADDVAKYTGRARTIESRYLAKLNKLGIIARVKEGRKTYYLEPIYAVQQYYSLYGESILFNCISVSTLYKCSELLLTGICIAINN